MTRHLRTGRYPAVLLLAAFAACGAEPRPAAMSGEHVSPPVQVLVAVPVLPGAKPIAAAGTAEAVSTTLRSDYLPDSAAAWYRRALLAGGWRLIGDQKNPDGTISIHAERNGPPLWIIVNKGPGGRGSELQIIGAIVDTTGAGH